MYNIGYFSAISGFNEIYETEDYKESIKLMDELYAKIPPIEMVGKVCVRMYKSNVVIQQYGSV